MYRCTPTWNQFHFVYYSLLYILLYWAKHDNQPEAEKSLWKAQVGKYYNNYIAYCLFIIS